MNWTPFLAVWGAALSTVLGIAQIIQWVEKRRGRIKIIVDTNHFWWDGKKHITDMNPGVIFRAVNDSPKPVMIDGLMLKVGSWEKDLTPLTEGTRNLTVISEGEEFCRFFVDKSDLCRIVRQGCKHPPPWKCEAIVLSRAGRSYRQTFTLGEVGIAE